MERFFGERGGGRVREMLRVASSVGAPKKKQLVYNYVIIISAAAAGRVLAVVDVYHSPLCFASSLAQIPHADACNHRTRQGHKLPF